MAGSSCTDIAAADSIECLASGHFDRKIRMWDARLVSCMRVSNSHLFLILVLVMPYYYKTFVYLVSKTLFIVLLVTL